MNDTLQTIMDKLPAIGGGTTVITGVGAYNELIPLAVAVTGAAVAILSYVTNLYFKIQQNKREEKLYLLKAENMSGNDRRATFDANYEKCRRTHNENV